MESQLTFWQAFYLAVIQGATEFIPVSSSGHLVLMRKIFGWSDKGGLVFDTILHAGSLSALLIYFWREWKNIIKSYFVRTNPEFSWYRRLPWLLVVATMPVVIAGPIFKPILESENIVRTSTSAGLCMIMTALWLWLSELRFSSNPNITRMTRNIRPSGCDACSGLALSKVQQHSVEQAKSKPIGFLHALFIGCMQIVALLPGASRSGWTAGAGILCGHTRESAVRFAFFMAIPAITGAIIFQIKDIIVMSRVELEPTLIITGFIVSFLVSLGAIHLCLIYFRAHSLKIFSVYLVVVGLLAVLL